MNAQLHEALETLRETRFKLKSLGILLKFARTKLSDEERGRIDVALFELSRHTRGERPLTFEFMGEKVKEP